RRTAPSVIESAQIKVKNLVAVAVIILASQGCSSSSTPVCGSKLGASGYVPGARLKPLGYKHAKGATIQWGIMDSTFGPCSFVSLADKSVCVPAATAFYSDADCQTAVYTSSICPPSTLPQYVSVMRNRDFGCGESIPS